MKGKPWYWDIALALLASPVIVLIGIVRLCRRWPWVRARWQPALACRTCGGQVALVGFWRCRCGYTYLGHLLRLCPVCASYPAMVRCYRCGATQRVGR